MGLLEGDAAVKAWGVQESKQWTGGKLMRREGTSSPKRVFDENYTRLTCPCRSCVANRADAVEVARLRAGGAAVEVLGEPKACKLAAKWDALEAGGA